MKRKVVQTELEPAEYSALAAIAKWKGLIKEALREAALRWTREESGINPNDPIFHVKAGIGARAQKTRLKKSMRLSTDRNQLL